MSYLQTRHSQRLLRKCTFRAFSSHDHERMTCLPVTVGVKNECPPVLPRTPPKFYHLSLCPHFIAAPPSSVKILHRRGISLIRFLISFMMIFSHSSNITCFSFAMVSHLHLLICCLRMFDEVENKVYPVDIHF
jgi:hypothetical protein